MELTREERNLKVVMGILGVIFLGAEITFLFLQKPLFDAINTMSSVIGNFPPVPYSTEKFWISLSNAMMLMIVYISFSVYKDVRKNMNLVSVLLLGKFVSSISGLIYFLVSDKYLAHLMVPISDFPIFLVVLYFYGKAKNKCS